MRHTLEILVAVPSIASAMAICMTVLRGLGDVSSKDKRIQHIFKGLVVPLGSMIGCRILQCLPVVFGSLLVVRSPNQQSQEAV